jgi:hypothetical protein
MCSMGLMFQVICLYGRIDDKFSFLIVYISSYFILAFFKSYLYCIFSYVCSPSIWNKNIGHNFRYLSNLLLIKTRMALITKSSTAILHLLYLNFQ